jgi:HAAS domain-containing protein
LTREEYVYQLERRLPFALGHRARAIAEVREHLREGGEEALRRFGSVEELAEELRPELRARAAATASWLVPILAVAFVVPFYLIPENAFPPAPWVEVPGYLAWKHDAALVAFAVAVGAAGVAVLAGRISPRWALAPLWLCFSALIAAATFAMVMDAQWIEEVPGTSAALVYGGLLPLRLGVIALAGLVLAGALRDGRHELAAD